MFRRFIKNEPSNLDPPIERILLDMEMYGPDADEYPALLSYLERLSRIKTEDRPKSSISPDTVLMVAGNLLGILIIVAYEREHAMVSKGLGFILKPKTPNNI